MCADYQPTADVSDSIRYVSPISIVEKVASWIPSYDLSLWGKREREGGREAGSELFPRLVFGDATLANGG